MPLVKPLLWTSGLIFQHWLVPENTVHLSHIPFPYRYWEVQVGITDPVPAGGPTHPWPTPGNTDGPGLRYWCNHIGGEGEDSSLSPAPTQERWTHPLPHVEIQTVAAGFIPWGELENPHAYGALDVPGGNCSTHVANRGYTTGVGVDCPGKHT